MLEDLKCLTCLDCGRHPVYLMLMLVLMSLLTSYCQLGMAFDLLDDVKLNSWRSSVLMGCAASSYDDLRDDPNDHHAHACGTRSAVAVL